MAMSEWILNEPSEGLKLLAEKDGVWLRSLNGTSIDDLRQFRPRGRLGRLLPTLVPQLVEMGLATAGSSGVRIDYRDYSDLSTGQGIDAFDGLIPWARWVLQLETTGSPGSVGFKYFYRFY